MHEETTQHTFGGRALDRYVYEFETVEGGEGGEAIGGLEGSEVGAGELGARVEPPAAPAAAAAAGGEGEGEGEGAGGEQAAEPLSAEELSQMIREGSGEAFRELLAQAEHEEAQRRAAEQGQQQPELPEWDPFNPEVVQQHIMAALAPVFTQINQQMQPAIEAASERTREQGETQARELLTAHAKEIGEFDQDRAIKDASFALREAAQAGKQVDAEQVLKDAAAELRAWEEKIEQRGIDKFKAQAGNLAGATTELGSGAAGEVVQHVRGKQAYHDQLARSLANQGRGPGVGTPTG